MKEAQKQAELGLQLSKEENNIYGLLYSTKAKILYEQQEYKNALISADKALKYLKQKKSTTYWQISAHDIIANIELKNGNYASAEKHIQEAFNLISTDRKREYSSLYILKSRLYFQKKNYKSALKSIDEGLAILDNQFNETQGFPNTKNLYPEIKLQLALVLKGDILAATNRKEEALTAYLLANQVSELLRSGYTYLSSKKKQQEEAKLNAEK